MPNGKGEGIGKRISMEGLTISSSNTHYPFRGDGGVWPMDASSVVMTQSMANGEEGKYGNC